jgi:hypothetical protein
MVFIWSGVCQYCAAAAKVGMGAAGIGAAGIGYCARIAPTTARRFHPDTIAILAVLREQLVVQLRLANQNY